MIPILNAINRIFSLIFFPLQRLAPVWGLLLISVLTGMVILLIFRYTSNQKAIKKSRDRIKAHILELLYYKDSIRVMLRALLKILGHNTIYLRYAMVPLLIVMIPMIILFIQLNFRYQYRPLKTNETCIVKMRLSEQAADSSAINILSSDAVQVETPALRMNKRHDYNWRIRAKKTGLHQIIFSVPGGQIEKTIVVDDQDTALQTLSPKKVKNRFWDILFNPVEKPLPADMNIESIELMYPDRENRILGIRLHWLLIFFLVTMIVSFSLKNLFGVTF